MMNKGTNLKVAMLAILFTVGMISCNNGSNNDSENVTDSTETNEVEVAEVDQNATASPAEVKSFDGEYKIVYINTDSLVNQYQFFLDGNEKMERAESSMRKQYEGKAVKLQAEYEEYMRQGKAGMLTLKQQQDTEASLTKQQENLMEMDKKLSEQLMMQKQVLNQQINDTIVTFINKYRIEKGYTLILQHSYLNGVLSADPSLDITDEVIQRLNAKYTFDKSHL